MGKRWVALGMGVLGLAIVAAGCNGTSDEDEAGRGKGNDPGDLFDDPTLGNDPQGACGQVDVTFEQRIPYVALLVDQSGSMNENFGGGTRWEVMRDALLDQNNGIVKRLEDEVRFGLSLYTSQNGFEGGTCPMLTGVAADFGNYQKIRAVWDAAQPEDDTPTGESILAIAKQLQAIKDDDAPPKAIVLATDGHPDTCAQPDPQNGQQVSIDAAQQAFAMGIRTYVISVGDEIGDDHLQDMANAGAGLEVGGSMKATFYKALDQGQLEAAFDTIVDGVRDCIFTLDGEVVAGYEDQGVVVLDGEPLDKDDPDGWQLNSSKEVQLLGEACASIQDGEHKLSIDFPCGGYEPPPID
ncbi:MAG: vWA domain-containing protein [Polyangiaceae bacterium]